MTRKHQQKGEHQLIAHTRRDHHLQNRLVHLHEAPDADVRCQQGDFEPQEGQSVDRAARVLQLRQRQSACMQPRYAEYPGICGCCTLLNGTTFASGKYAA